jgi:hypothetical protein
LDATGLVYKISDAALAIDSGRKGFAIEGKEREGRILYEDGISKALSAFEKAQSTADPQIIILVEYTFLNQEFHLCEKTDTDTLNSLTQAIQSFDDAFLALKAVEDRTLYKGAELTHPHSKKHRVNAFPNDSYHIACKSHRTRLQNILRSPGIDPIEKNLLEQRFANLATAQSGYVEKQKKAMG